MSIGCASLTISFSLVEKMFFSNLVWMPFYLPYSFIISEAWELGQVLKKHENVKVAHN
jgi:hypothetical protein